MLQKGLKARAYFHLRSSESWRPEHSFPTRRSRPNLHIMQCTEMEKKLQLENPGSENVFTSDNLINR